jgi:methionine sulfoxide reductase heme-binding subunit
LTLIAAAGPSAYWYLTRGAGAVSLILLTGSVVLGLLGSLRFALAPRWPRFTIDMLHRDISLLAVAVLAVHIITSVLDSFAPVKLTDAVIPFVSQYRPLWVGLGALAFDLVLALVITSLVRRRLGYQRWRAVHWFAYACWPVAVLHGLGTGSDTKIWWMLVLTAACVAAVLAAVWVRLARLDERHGVVRTWGFVASIGLPLAGAIFTLQGPLQTGWAKRAGTPSALLAKPGATPVASASSKTARRVSSKLLNGPFSAQLNGTVSQTAAPGGGLIDMTLRLTGGARGTLRIRLAGAPIGNGGLSLTGSQVDLIAAGIPTVMQGKVISLQGQQFVARVSGNRGSVLTLRASINIDQQSDSIQGTLDATPGGSGQ